MEFKESIKCNPKKSEQEELVEAYIKYVEAQGENFLEFIETLNDCIGIAEKYELIGNVNIKARIKDFDSSKRNSDKKALDDTFGVEIIPTTERDKEWIMLLTELIFRIGKNQGFDRESNGYKAYNQMVSLRDSKEEYDFSKVTEIIKNSKIKVKISDDRNGIKTVDKYPVLKEQMLSGKSLDFNELENRAMLEIIQKLDAFRSKIKFYKTCNYMPIVEMQMKTLDVAEQAIRGRSKHDGYKVIKKEGLTEEEKQKLMEEHESRIKRLYESGYIRRGVNAPIKFERINGKMVVQNFEKTLIEMWPFLRENIVKDRMDFGRKKAREYNKHTAELLTIYPFLKNYIPVKDEIFTDEAKTKIILAMMNTDISSADCSKDKTKRRRIDMKKPELLAPAGSFEKAKTAFLYGADAVYMGTSNLSLRSRVTVDDDELLKTIEYAHSINKKVYTALNIYARDYMYDEVKKQAQILNNAKVDGIIVSDGGVLEILKEYAPDVELHISTQTNIVGYHAGNFWYKNGAKRIVIARELSKEEIKELMDNKPKDLEVEMFIHGAICYAYSGRCHLSDFLASRCGNLGDCAQSCRWAYNIYLEEKNNPGNIMPVEEDKNGTYILSSKDLCLIKELPEVVDMGIDSLKIEGRLKTEYYLATVINTYRNAIDDYMANPNEYNYTKYLKELEKTKTRGLTTFYFNDKNNKDFQEYEGKQYNPDYEFGGKILERDNKGKTTVEIRNRLQLGDILEVIIPNKIESEPFKIEKMWDVETGEEIPYINPGKEGQKVILNIPLETKEGWILRRKK